LNTHQGARTAGVIVGILLALAAAGLCASVNQESTGYADIQAGIGQLVFGVLFGIPLLLLNIGLTNYLLNRDAVDGRVLRWMWLPTVVVLVLGIAYSAATNTLDANYRQEHPSITEVHTNLSGRALWLAPEVDSHKLEPGEARQVWRERTLKDHDDPMTEYAGRRLAPGLKSITIRTGEPNGATATRVPVAVLPEPDLKALAPLDSDLGPRLTYMYFHYPDRVEIAPALDVWRDHLREHPTAHTPLVYIHMHNLAAPAIARLELDGLTVYLQEPAKQASPDTTYCKIPHAATINRLAASMKVRWQTVGQAPAWNEAVLTLPTLAPPEPAQGTVRQRAVHLFFLPGGAVAAQLAQDIGLPEEAGQARTASGSYPSTRNLRLSQAMPSFTAPMPCGGAAEAYLNGL
jgi:hypothetical protein